MLGRTVSNPIRCIVDGLPGQPGDYPVDVTPYPVEVIERQARAQTSAASWAEQACAQPVTDPDVLGTLGLRTGQLAQL